MNQLEVKKGTKAERYQTLLTQIGSLVDEQIGLIGNLANITAALHQTFPEFSWVGFYLLKEDVLVLGPFQGKVACTKLKVGEGVCGRAVEEKKTQVIDDVAKIENHVYCDPDTQSEIVVPIIENNTVKGVLDIDSYRLGQFDKTDADYLNELVDRVVTLFQ